MRLETKSLVSLKFGILRTFRRTILVAILSNLPTDCRAQLLAASIQSPLPDCTATIGVSTEYLDPMAFACRECPDGKVADEAGRACICEVGSVPDKAEEEGGEIPGTCTACPDGQRPNKQGTACLECLADGSDDATETVTIGGKSICGCPGSDPPRTKAVRYRNLDPDDPVVIC